MELVQTYPGRLRKISLIGNNVHKSTMAVIRNILKANNQSDHVEEDTSEDDAWSTSTDKSNMTSSTNKCSSSDGTSLVSCSSTSSSDGTLKNSDSVSQQDSHSSTGETETNVVEEEVEDSCEELKEVPVYGLTPFNIG